MIHSGHATSRPGDWVASRGRVLGVGLVGALVADSDRRAAAPQASASNPAPN